MIKRVKSKFLASVKSKKINIFLLFLGLSFAILLLTKLSKDYTKTITFNIEKENIPIHQVVLSDSTNILDVTLKTHGFNLLKYYLAKPRIKIDFGNVSKNDSIYFWTKNNYFSKVNEQLNKDVNIINISPDTLLFKYDVNEVKKVPIILNANISFSPGFDLMDGYTLEPDSVNIIGPKNLVIQIDSIFTEQIELFAVKSSINKEVKLVFPETREVSFSNTNTTISGNVERFTEGVVNVPVIVTNVPDKVSIKYFPKSVNLTYYTSLSAFNDISVRDFKIECDYRKLNEGDSYLIPEVVKQPNNIKSLKINQQRVEFIKTE